MLDWIQMGLLVTALITIVVSSYWSAKTINATQKQAKRQYEFQFFAEYTKRYQDLMLKMPADLDTSSVFNIDVKVFRWL